MALKPTDARGMLVVEMTEGDFPHARRRGVRLACCTCTSCCFTLLFGGVGGLVGLVKGLMEGTDGTPCVSSPGLAIFVGILWILARLVVYAVVGILIGAAAGFAIDVVVFH